MTENIMVLGVGNILYRDDGVGIRVVEKLERQYDFSDNVTLVDGGVLGINLLGIIAGADKLIVVDTVLNHGAPGDFHRLEHEDIPNRILAKNSLHQVDFLEALTLCSAIDGIQETVILGAEPEDIDTLEIELTPTLRAKVDKVISMVLDEMDRLGVPYRKRS